MTRRPDHIADPLHFWASAFIRLGVILLLLGLVPMLFDYLFFNGGAALIAIMALLSAAPLGLVILVIGLVIWGVRKARR